MQRHFKQHILFVRQGFPIGLACVAAMALAIAGCGDVDSNDALANEAISADSDEQSLAATRELAQRGHDSKEQLRRILLDSERPAVQAEAALALGNAKDVEAMPLLIDELGSASQEVRQNVNTAIIKIIGRDYYFDPSKSPESQTEAINAIREFWQVAQSPETKFIEYSQDEEKLNEVKRRAAERMGDRRYRSSE